VIPVKYMQQADLYPLSGPFADRIGAIVRVQSLALKKRLDCDFPLGINPEFSGVRFGRGPDDLSVMDVLFDAKSKYPEAVVLLRVGDFYEAYGQDAVFLAEHAGLNAMGSGGLAKAGAPVVNIHAVISSLTAEGIKVAVCEQVDEPMKKRKRRFLAAVLTPESPVYSYGLAGSARNPDFPASAPYFSVRQSRGGFDLAVVYADERKVLLFEGLHASSLQAMISSHGLSRPTLFVAGQTSSQTRDFLRDTVADIPGSKIKRFGDHALFASTEGFAEMATSLVRGELALPDTETFIVRRIPYSPLFIPHDTAEQIGLGRQEGVPSLIEFCLPHEALAFDRDLLRDILLRPHGPDTKSAMRQLIEYRMAAVSASESSVPAARPAKFIKTIAAKDASTAVFKELHDVVKSFILSAADDLASRDALLVVTSSVSGLPFTGENLGKTAEALTFILGRALSELRQPDNSNDLQSFISNVDDGASRIVSRLASPHYGEALDRWDDACRALCQAVDDIGNEKVLRIDQTKGAIYLKTAVDGIDMVHAIERDGTPINGYTTVEIRDAVEALFLARATLFSAGVQSLKSLCSDVEPYARDIIGITYAVALFRLAGLLALSAKRRGWQTASSAGNTLSITSGFPYWMTASHAVENDFDASSGLRVLVAPNMSGKSTYLRMIASVTLLASCGLPYPARAVSLGRGVDAIFLRMGVADDPARGLSSFAVEMKSVASILAHATERSVVLLDELGKGTSSRDGAAIAGAVLEALMAKSIAGVFATHWHEIFEMSELRIARDTVDHMEILGGAATHRVSRGLRLDSLAIGTALAMGVPAEVVARAGELSGRSLVSTPVVDVKKTMSDAQAALRQASGAGAEPLLIAGDQSPPPALAGESCIYILKTAAGLFYAGETDDITRRLAEHRQDERKKACDVAIIALGTKDKTRARSIERTLIRLLSRSGFPMLSEHDA
jgi:predicted GIY-YIG superfamily endonuclease